MVGTRLWLSVLLLCSLGLPAWAAGSWSGGWDTRWRGGGTHMELTQNGQTVTGSYPLYGGKIEAQANGPSLDGTWSEGTAERQVPFRHGR